jgi:dihydrodipicolinate synthase/N-acetylneuraminate lyase
LRTIKQDQGWPANHRLQQSIRDQGRFNGPKISLDESQMRQRVTSSIKEFSGDVRRVVANNMIMTPRVEVLVGADDVLLELTTGGVVGWIAGFPNALT